MMAAMRLLAALFVLAVLPGTAFACPSGIEPSFEFMIKEATLIVRGQVIRETGSSRNAQGVMPHRSEVLVERTYKGAASRVIRVNWKDYYLCPRAYLAKNDYGLFFLRASGSEFVLVDEQFGKLAVSRSQDTAPSLDPFVAIERDLKRAIRIDSGRQRIENVLLLGSLRRPISTAELHALLPTRDGVLESAVHLTLLKLFDYSRLEAAGRLVETVPANRSFSLPKDEALHLRTKISFEIMRIEDPTQLPVLQRLSLSSHSYLRQNVAYALRHAHDFSNVRYLIKLIEDPAEETRDQALRGLQELVRPGTGGWSVARWQSWWRTEGKSKYGK
jgi:hypothetical protein